MKKILGIISLMIVLLVLFPVSGKTSYYNIDPQPSESQNSLTILTLNVMQYAPNVPRDTRFQGIADFLRNKNVQGLSLQELSGGPYDTPPTTIDSGIDLAQKLAQQGQYYGYYTRDSYGYPPYFSFKVGVMPKYTMLFTNVTKLDPPGQDWSDPPGPSDFDGRSNVVMCGLYIPGIGRVNFYSTHVYPTAILSRQQTQIENLIQFIHQVDQSNPARVTIVGGDMNFAVSPATQSIYQLFLKDGFLDSYAAVNLDPGYTFGLPDNPFTDPSVTSPSRIDYLFVKGDNLQIARSEVVFNGLNGAFVSDHCGVLTEINVVPLPANSVLLGSGLLIIAVRRSWRTRSKNSLFRH